MTTLGMGWTDIVKAINMKIGTMCLAFKENRLFMYISGVLLLLQPSASEYQVTSLPGKYNQDRPLKKSKHMGETSHSTINVSTVYNMAHFFSGKHQDVIPFKTILYLKTGHIILPHLVQVLYKMASYPCRSKSWSARKSQDILGLSWDILTFPVLQLFLSWPVSNPEISWHQA